MKIDGTSEVPAPRDRVWAALLDPGTLATVIPGCEKLEAVGPDEYKAVMKVGVGPVKGTFEGKVRISEQQPPSHYRMAIVGSGGPGFVRGDAAMDLAEADGGTRVTYAADVQIGGLIASVGQRMLGGVSRMMLDQFFARLTEVLGAAK